MSSENDHLGIVLRGISVSPGVSIGNATLIDQGDIHVEHIRLPAAMVASELYRFEDAIKQAENRLDELAQRIKDSGQGQDEHTSILAAHKVMLRDPVLLQRTKRYISEELLNAEWALARALDELQARFSEMKDEFFRERSHDVQHVVELLQRSLQEDVESGDPFSSVGAGSIVVAHLLSPAETLELCRRKIAALVIGAATPTSHTAIIACSMGIPTVVGLPQIVNQVAHGDRLIVDGTEGELIIHPASEEELLYERRRRRANVLFRTLRQNRRLPAITPDGHKLVVSGNVDVMEELTKVIDQGAQGVGLFRTEFLFLERDCIPSEDEQVRIYQDILAQMSPKVVTIRTLDIGGDKLMPALREGTVAHSGLRAIRYCLKEPGVFRTQLRALLRASPQGSLRLLVPFISEISEVRAVKSLLSQIQSELREEGYAFNPNIPLGFMIEIPSAALIADLIAREANFLSVGTNDLIQYATAISRDNPALDYLYYPLHPAILRLLQMVTRAAHASKIPVAVCGEMAGDPQHTLILMALGFDELSMSARSVPLVKEIIRRTPKSTAIQLFQSIAQVASAQEITDIVYSYMVEHYSEIVVPRIRQAPHYMR